MNILRRALFHQNLFSNSEDVYPGSPLSAPVQSQTSHHLSGGLQVENYLFYTVTFNLSGAAPTWGITSAVYTQNSYSIDSEGNLGTSPFTTFNKGQISTGTGTTDPVHARIDINITSDPNLWLGGYPKSWGVLMHIKSGVKVPLIDLSRNTASIIRCAGQARFDTGSLTAGDAMILKMYLQGNPR